MTKVRRYNVPTNLISSTSLRGALVGPPGHTCHPPGRAHGAATAPKAGTMFPTRDLLDGYERLLERDRVHQLLLEARPELADRIEVDESNPVLRLPTRHGVARIL